MKDELHDIEELFNLHYEFLCNVANRLLNDPDASRDVVQDVFLNMWRKRNELQIKQSGRAYLHKAVVNGALQHLRKNKGILPIEDVILLGIADNSAMQTDLQYKELEESYHKALNLLPAKCRAVFVLSRYEEMKYKEIASHLNISIKTVETQMSIALKRLKEYLGPLLAILLLFLTFC